MFNSIPYSNAIFALLKAGFVSCFDIPSCRNCVELSTQVNILKADVGFWKSCHAKALEREKVLKTRVEELEAKVKLRERQLFARKSEKESKGKEQLFKQGNTGNKRRRGQQCGAKGHGRRHHLDLPVRDEYVDLPEDQRVCEHCGLPFECHGGTEDSEVIEIEVRAYRRRVHRKRYVRSCQCSHLPQVITAPPVPKLIPKGGYGISIWVMLLLGKFLYQRPLYRILTELRERHNLNISPGTITGGFQTLMPLFEHLYAEIVRKNLTEGLWHADETRWLVFAGMAEKSNHRWYLWIYCSKTTVVFRIEPTRSSKVPRDHFGDSIKGILVVDRYSAYKVLLKSGRILLAFCWAHVRRDFLSIAKDLPHLESWAMAWVDRIGKLYAANDNRLKVLDAPDAFIEAQTELATRVENMAVLRDEQLEDGSLHSKCRKALESLSKHWSGLTIFVSHPEVPMDNNYGEQQLRNPVTGRKQYYGSGAIWSAAQSAMLFSLFQTLRLWRINPDLWLTHYLSACAENGGTAPENAESFLPWNMSPSDLSRFIRGSP